MAAAAAATLGYVDEFIVLLLHPTCGILMVKTNNKNTTNIKQNRS